MAPGKRRNFKNEKLDAEIKALVELPSLLQRFSEMVLSLNSFITAMKLETERKAKEAEEEADSPELKAQVESVHLQRLQAEREEYDARIAKAHLEKLRWAQRTKEWQEWVKHQSPQKAATKYDSPRPKSEVQTRIEESKKPLTATAGEISAQKDKTHAGRA